MNMNPIYTTMLKELPEDHAVRETKAAGIDLVINAPVVEVQVFVDHELVPVEEGVVIPPTPQPHELMRRAFQDELDILKKRPHPVKISKNRR